MSFDPEARRDPFRGGFRGLVGLDEDRLAPGIDAPSLARQDQEILTYVVDGVLVHEDDLGKPRVIRTGDFQLITAGTGMRHQRSNGSRLETATVFESRLQTDTLGQAPQCLQRRFAAADRKGIFLLVASPDSGPGSFRIRQDIRVYSSLPDRGCHLIHAIEKGRHAWLQVIRGRLRLQDLTLAAGDGVAFRNEISVSITALESSELLLFDLA